MDYYNDTPSSRKNKHLNDYERGKIELLHAQGLSPYAIGKRIGRASNTIRNELTRGTVTQVKADRTCEIYYPDAGRRVYESNRKKSGCKFKYLQCQDFISYATDLFLAKNHSLDSICGAAKKNNVFPLDAMVSTKTLYNYVDAGLLQVRNIDLPLKTRRTTKPKRIRQNKKVLGTSITERPQAVNERKEFGHWEIDTVIGKKKKSESVLLTITERLTRKEVIRKIPNKSAASVQECLSKIASEIGTGFSKVFKSFTADNGSEFADLSLIEQTSDVKVYFAHPYSSGERGTNERHNGLIRRFIPKGKSLNEYSPAAVAKVQIWCNTLPRKILGYLTPDEAFLEQCKVLL